MGMFALRRDAGFTLIEMVVALAIFSLAALALLRLQGASVRGTAELSDRAIGQIVVRNLMVEALIDEKIPVIGETSGAVTNGGRVWRWLQTIKRTEDPRILRYDIAVVDAYGRRSGSLTFARPMQ
jgi:general secretion pathway protein I